MAIQVGPTHEFEGGLASLTIVWDDATMQVTAVSYRNETTKTARALVSEGPRSQEYVVQPGTPSTSIAVPKNRYTFSPDPNEPGGVVPNFSFNVQFT